MPPLEFPSGAIPPIPSLSTVLPAPENCAFPSIQPVTAVPPLTTINCNWKLSSVWIKALSNPIQFSKVNVTVPAFVIVPKLKVTYLKSLSPSPKLLIQL